MERRLAELSKLIERYHLESIAKRERLLADIETIPVTNGLPVTSLSLRRPLKSLACTLAATLT